MSLVKKSIPKLTLRNLKSSPFRSFQKGSFHIEIDLKHCSEQSRGKTLDRILSSVKFKDFKFLDVNKGSAFYSKLK